MTNFIFANNISTTLASAITGTSVNITLSSSKNLPSSIPSGYALAITLNDAATGSIFEVMYATAISAAALTVTRGQEGTSAIAWAAGDYVYATVTAGELTGLLSTSVAASTYQPIGSYAALAGSASQQFAVATATSPSNATPLSQTGTPNRTQQFLSNGSWTCPQGITSALVTICGGGGGGGYGGPAKAGGGGGGGAQGYYKQAVTVSPGNVYAVTVGAYGAGGATAGTNGGNGGNTVFGSLLGAAGGAGGIAGTSSSVASGGAAGGAGGIAGITGTYSSTQGLSNGGAGGGCLNLGAGGAGGSNLNQGQTASGYGAGGGGGAGEYIGGNGAPGFVMVEW